MSFEYHWNSSVSSKFVFISYSSVDNEVANAVAKKLVDNEIDYFLDRKDVDWGDHVNEEIQQGLKKASHIIIIVSPASLKSGWVSYEVGYAIGKNKTVLPLLTHPSIDVPSFMSELHYKTNIESIDRYFKERL